VSVSAAKTLTLEEYLTLEQTSETRHEFVDGMMIAMAGEKRRHNYLVRSFVLWLEAIARQQSCELAIGGVKVRTKVNRVRYPDVVISCAPGDDEYFIENPCFIAEVLSASTEHTDLFTKLDEYKQLPSLERYAVISQDSRGAVLYKRVNSHWEVETLTEGEIDIPCIQTTIRNCLKSSFSLAEVLGSYALRLEKSLLGFFNKDFSDAF
jgi:Uma2 family endonuclease